MTWIAIDHEAQWHRLPEVAMLNPMPPPSGAPRGTVCGLRIIAGLTVASACVAGESGV